MRALLLFVLFIAAVCAFGQAPSQGELVRPDAYVKVSKDSSGVDILEVTMLKANYPADLLRQQLTDLGKTLGSETKIILAERHNPTTGQSGSGLLRITASVPGLIDRKKNVLGLQALARAFAGVAEPNTIDGLMIQYTSETPNAKVIQRFTSQNVRVSGQADPRTGVEYRITLISQVPAEIVIPEGEETTPAVAKPPVPPPSGPGTGVIILIIVAALALGALVYSLLVRQRPNARSK